MTRVLHTDDVDVELGTGTWTARWLDAGVVAGPFGAAIELEQGSRNTAAAAGRWQVVPGDGYGRPGVWARWLPRDHGPELTLHVPASGPMVVVELAYRAAVDERLARLVPVSGSVDLGAPPDRVRRLVDGYDSWSYSGVRAASEPGASWSRAAFVRAGGDGALAIQALDAGRFATAVASRPEAGQLRVEVHCGATPTVVPVEGTWGYEVHPPSPLGLPLPAGTREHSPAVAVTAGADPFSTVEDSVELAGLTSGRREWAGAPIAGWESWYHYGLFVEVEEILENARLLRDRYRDRPAFDLVQIDDGWQVTYGEWTPNDRFPADLADLVHELRALGCRAGLWLAPFMVQPDAPGLARDHPEWLTRRPDGELAFDRHGRFALDASCPDAASWLHTLGTRVREWGFEMVKLDFLYLGALEGVRSDPRTTGTEALRLGLRAFLDGLGDDVYVLACGAPMLPLVGLAHGSRVGHDLAVPVRLQEFGHPIAEGWTGFHGIRPQARNVAARWALHRRWFECDPDVVMAWGCEADVGRGGYRTEESRTLATLAALCGGPFLLADELAQLDPAARAVLEDPAILELAHCGGFRPVDLFDHIDRSTPEEFFTQAAAVTTWCSDDAGTAVTARFNLSDEPVGDLPAHGVRVVRSE